MALPTEEVVTLINTYNTLWNEHDLDGIDGMHHPDIVFQNHTAGDRAEGKEAVREHIRQIFEKFPDLAFRPRGEVRAGEDFAVSEWTATATRDGKKVEWDGVDVFPIRDGQIIRKDVYSSSHRPRELSD
jgi:taurine dehydrogenase small subunit